MRADKGYQAVIFDMDGLMLDTERIAMITCRRAAERWLFGVKRNRDIIMTMSDWDYRGLAAECYDLWFGDEPFWDQAFFHDRIHRNRGVALEIAYGTGRLLVPLLRDGLVVEGLDASEEMLAICRTKAAHVGVPPLLYQQHMQDVTVASRYRTIFIPACSFQILAERDEAFAALRQGRSFISSFRENT
jgi:Methyltransferase domain